MLLPLRKNILQSLMHKSIYRSICALHGEFSTESPCSQYGIKHTQGWFVPTFLSTTNNMKVLISPQSIFLYSCRAYREYKYLVKSPLYLYINCLNQNGTVLLLTEYINSTHYINKCYRLTIDSNCIDLTMDVTCNLRSCHVSIKAS